ncbi:MAG: type II 3-dehydroquinate dehydratase [Bacteroidales bacterium]|nr:type II 3-dehydroquinate dehydratase [Bacteroidales bacterium]
MKIIIINGPNLNLLGKREPSIYGDISFENVLQQLQIEFLGIEISYYQSNVEGELINKIQESDGHVDGIVLNAGAYTHTSIALGDAIKAIKTAVVEVHISNIFSREDFRHVSYISPYCAGSIIGFGMDSYRLAIKYFQGK